MQIKTEILECTAKAPADLMHTLEEQAIQIKNIKDDGESAIIDIIKNREMKDMQLLNQQNIEMLKEEIQRMKNKTFPRMPEKV